MAEEIDIKKYKNQEFITLFLKDTHMSIAKFRDFLQHGADPNAIGDNNQSIIMIAAIYYRLDIVEYLITRLVNLDVVDKFGKNLLDYIIDLKNSEKFTNFGFINCPHHEQNGEEVYIVKIENWINLMQGKVDLVSESIVNHFIQKSVEENGNIAFNILPRISYNRFAEIMEMNIILPKRFYRHVGTDFSKQSEIDYLDLEMKPLYNKIIMNIKANHKISVFSHIKSFMNSNQKIETPIERMYKLLISFVSEYLHKKVQEVYDSRF